MKPAFQMNLIFLALIASASVEAQASEWDFQLEPYLMTSSIKGDAGVGKLPQSDVDVGFDAIWENLESAAMLHFEAHHESGWGMAFDYGYMDLGKKVKNDVGTLNTEVRQGVFEGMAMYRTQFEHGTLDYFGGVRWWDNDLELELSSQAYPDAAFYRDTKADWVDLVVGARWIGKINEEWNYLAQLDVGGFGAESDFTSSTQMGVQYKMTESMTLDLKYKATWVDYAGGTQGETDYFQYDTVTKGAVVGLIVDF